MRLATLVLIASLVAGACASGREAKQQTNRSVIAEAQLREAAAGTTVEQYLSRNKPEWLRGRGRTTIRSQTARLVVYVNNQRSVGTEMLRTLTTDQVREIRFLDAIVATQRFGTDHGSGALLITLK